MYNRYSRINIRLYLASRSYDKHVLIIRRTCVGCLLTEDWWVDFLLGNSATCAVMQQKTAAGTMQTSESSMRCRTCVCVSAQESMQNGCPRSLDV